MKVVIVDDTHINLVLMSRLIAKLEEVETQTFQSAVEALAWCRAMMPDLILLDAGMPLMSGLDFLRRLRLEPGGRAPKVVFCSAETNLDRIREALDAGAAEYIIKPFDGDIVAEKLALAGAA